INTYFSHLQAHAKREIRKTPKGLDYELIALLDGTFASKQKRKTYSIRMFKTVERYFEAIDSPTTSVLVPFDEGKDIISSMKDDIQESIHINKVTKRIQQYSVNLYNHELYILSYKDLIEPIYDISIYCIKEKPYNEQ